MKEELDMARITKSALDSLAPEIELPIKSNRGRKAKEMPELEAFASAWHLVKVGSARIVPGGSESMDKSDTALLRHHLDRYMNGAGFNKKSDYRTQVVDGKLAIVKLA